MNFRNYLKERWITYLFLFFAFLFFLMVYILDQSFSVRASNANYILAGWGILFVSFFLIDYHSCQLRINRFKEYCRLNASSEIRRDFTYPSDLIYAEAVSELASSFEVYKAENETKAAEEMEFITKWIHDVKVPISAIRLILEQQEDKLPTSFFQNMDSEVFTIEESLLRVFYEIKTNRFFDDYKIRKISTKRLIAQALKGYSNFFSYKRLGISIEGDEYEVLTDEKWSGYILSQLISNAVKYTPEAGFISIRTDKTGKEVSVTVKNSGNGIPDRDMGQIFQKGYTSSEGRDGIKSTGYGLYLSNKLSGLLGHRLQAESRYGEYAAFSLIFSENDTLYQLSNDKIVS